MAAIKLSDADKRRFANLYNEFPEYSDALDTIIVESGFEAFDPYEHLPISPSAEWAAMKEGFKETITFGAYEGKEIPRAGDVEVPYFGEVQPSRIAGGVGGGLIPAGGAYIGAGKVARLAGMTQKASKAGGIAVEAAAAGKKLSLGGKVFQVVTAESVPGALQGWITSDGDVDEMIKMAAMWTAAGLMMEGTGTVAIRAWKKIREGKKLSPEEQTAARESARVAKEQAEEAGIPTDRDSRQQDSDNGISFKDIAQRFPGVSRWFDTEKAETIGKAIVSDDARRAILSAFRRGFLPNGERIAGGPPNPIPHVPGSIPRAEASNSNVALSNAVYEHIDRPEQYDAVMMGVNAIEEGYENLDLTSPHQGEELLQMYLHGELGFDEMENLIKRGIPADEAMSGAAGADRAVFNQTDFNNLVEKIHKRAIRNPTDALRDKGGRFDQRVSNRPATDAQKTRLAELVEDFNKSLMRQGISIDPSIVNKILDPSLSMAKARQMETLIRSEIGNFDYVHRQRAHSAILGDDIDPVRLQQILTENATKGWKAAFARTKGWQSEKSFKENIKEIREALVKERVRFKIDPEGKYWDPARMQDGDLKPGRARSGKEGPVTNIFQDLGLPYFLRIVPPYSRWGLGSHPLTKQGVEYGMNMFEEIGKLKMDWIGRYKKIVEPLDAGKKAQAAAALGRESGKRAVEEEIRKKNLLVQALNGDNTNEILKENGDLVDIYNQLRSLLDESGIHIGKHFDQAGYLKDYFPHLFNGTTGAYRATRLSMELGKRIGKITRFLDDKDVEKIPALKYFGSMSAREVGASGYDMDLDAVMYAYLSAAAEQPHFSKFLDRVHAIQGRLPEKDVDGRAMNLRGQFANWANYVVGKPTPWKHNWANWWKNNDLFNRNIDHMVELIGDAETKGLLTKLRGKTPASREGGYTFSKAEEQEVTDWFNRLIKDADEQTTEGKLKGFSVKKHRARLALKIDDIRAGLGNAHARPVVIESMYRTMVVAKLGLSASHAVINLTQTLANTMPLLGVKGVSRGISRYVGNKQAKFSNGETVEDVLYDSGILSDIPEAREFTPTRGLGFLSDLEETAMFPARMSEDFNRGVAFLGKYEKNLADGLEHSAAVIDARRFVQKTHFPFNRAGTIPLFHSPGARFLLMFKSYALHQMNFSAELLENAIKDGDVGPFAKHMLAYMALGSAASLAAGGGASNLPLQVGHPLEDFTPTNLANRGVLRTVGGPPADMMLDILHGDYMSAIESYDYTAFKRLREAHKEEEPSDAVLTGLGFR